MRKFSCTQVTIIIKIVYLMICPGIVVICFINFPLVYIFIVIQWNKHTQLTKHLYLTSINIANIWK